MLIKVARKEVNDFEKSSYRFVYRDFETCNEFYAPIGIHWFIKLWYNRKHNYSKSLLLTCFEQFIEMNFKVYPKDGDSAFAYDNEEFIEFTSCGEYTGKFSKKYKTSLGAVLALIIKMNRYLKEAKATGKIHLHWRIRPELLARFWENVCYTRFICSNTPFHVKGNNFENKILV